MSEEQQVSEGQTTTEQTAPGASFYYSDGVAGSGNAPEWFQSGKYKTVEDQAKAYPELQKMYGDLTNKYKGISGAPESYEIRAPEGVDIQVDAEDPVFMRATEWAKENGLPQETFDGLMGVYAELELAKQQAQNDFFKEEMGKIENFDNRSKNIDDFLKANNMESLAGVITSADQLEQFEKLLEMTGRDPVGVSSEGASVPSEEEIHKLMFEKDEFGRQIYGYDKERQGRVRKMWEARVGKGDYHQTVG